MFQLHTAAPAKVESVRAAIRESGFEPDDFRIDEDRDSDLSQVLGLVGGIVTVQRLSNGDERLYAGDPGSGWLTAFLDDLRLGRFGPPVTLVSLPLER